MVSFADSYDDVRHRMRRARRVRRALFCSTPRGLSHKSLDATRHLALRDAFPSRRNASPATRAFPTVGPEVH